MANTFSTEAQLQNNVPKQFPNAAIAGGRVRRYRNTVTLAAQPSADTITLTEIPAGSIFAYGVLASTVSLGSATLKIGTPTDDDAYRAAATFTTANQPVMFGLPADMAKDVTEANMKPIVTTGGAALPASGTLMVDLYFAAL